MPDVVHGSPQEFWRPPLVHSEVDHTSQAVTCRRCGSAFIIGSRFCHVCGASRPASKASAEHRWKRILESLKFLRVLEFHSVQQWFDLPVGSLAAFLIGMGCVLAAIAVGLIYSVQNFADFQAIQLWRIEWLLAAVAALLAGILLKKTERVEK